MQTNSLRQRNSILEEIRYFIWRAHCLAVLRIYCTTIEVEVPYWKEGNWRLLTLYKRFLMFNIPVK